MGPQFEILQFFEYRHLGPQQARVSRRFHQLAHELAEDSCNHAETEVALRKLLEAKDAAVRASFVAR